MKSYKDILESLKGGQRKLDKNKNGKLDASDFKALRNEEEDEVSEDMYSSDYKYNAATGRKTKAKRIAMNFGDKEDSEKDDEKKEVKEGMGHIDAIQKMMAKEREDQAKKKVVKTEQHAVAPVLDRKYIKGTPEHKAYKATKKPINGHPTNMNKEEAVAEAETTVTRDKAGKIISFKHVGDWKKSTSADKKKNPVGKVANIAGKAMQSMKKMANEEKDEGEYDYEGDMAISQLKTIIRHSEHLMGMLEPDTNLPEWVQSKITLATDYMQTAHDYMMSEMSESKKLSQKEIQSALTSDKNKAKPKDQVSLKKAPWDMKEEELDERNKENALKRKTMDASRGARYKAAGNKVPDAEPEHKTGQQHNKAIGRALRNEEIEEDEVKVSYRDFIKEYESKDGKYVHKGSYGTSYKDPEGDDEPSAKKPAAKKPGRPAGAKSGALQNRQPIKFK
jgi:hypothetical protein